MEQHIEITLKEIQPTNEVNDKEKFQILLDMFDEVSLETVAGVFANLFEVTPEWVKNSKTNKVEFFDKEDHEKFKAFAVGTYFTLFKC